MARECTYTIYALIDPGDNLVHYVGISVDAETRFYGHMHDVTGNFEERRWIKGFKKNGLSPILEVLEVIEGDNAHAIACEQEQYWISEMLRSGHPLSNVSGNTRPIYGRLQGNCIKYLTNQIFPVVVPMSPNGHRLWQTTRSC